MTVQSGSEKSITPKDKWISKFSAWDLNDDVPGPSSSAQQPATDDTEAAVESEESDDNEDYDQDDE